MERFFSEHPEIFDRLHDAVIATDLDGVVIACNAAAERIYGYSQQSLLGRSVAVLYPEPQLPRLEEMVKTVHSNGRADGEFLNRTSSGEEIWIHLSVSLLKTDLNVPYGMIGFSIDITAQKKAEEARRVTDEWNRDARAAARVGTWHWNLETGSLRWDELSSLLLDIPLDSEQSLEAVIHCVHPDDRKRLEEVLEQCIKTGDEYSAEYRVVCRDGSVRWISGHGRVARDEDGKAVEMLGVATDITARKVAEENLAKSQAKYRVIFDSPFVGVASANLDRITDTNDTFCSLLGYRRDDFLSGAVRWQDITPAEYLGKDYECLQEMLTAGVATPFEKEYIRGDGTRIRVLLGAALLSREPLEWSSFILDITHQHRAMAALRAGEQIASAARLGHALAHEINNPLASLTNILYLLRSGKTGRQGEELLTSANDALERITRITRQIIGVYSPSDDVSEFKVDNLLDDTIAAFASRTRAKNLHMQKRNEISGHNFRGVESDVRRLLSSLLENAVEHTQPGGTLQVHLFATREWKQERREGVRILVRDNGPGIPRDKLFNVFEPFYSTKLKKGSGLGLWTSRNIVEKHGGEVRVRSSTREGASGTCVSVFLPNQSRLLKLL